MSKKKLVRRRDKERKKIKLDSYGEESFTIAVSPESFFEMLTVLIPVEKERDEIFNSLPFSVFKTKQKGLFCNI